MRLVGYADNWSVRAGQTVGLHVSSRSAEVDVNLIRLRHGDDNPKGPGLQYIPVNSEVSGRYQACWHDVKSGSWMEVRESGSLLATDVFSFSIWVCATKPGSKRQAVLARGDKGPSLALNEDGHPTLSFGETQITAPSPLAKGEWYLLVARVDHTRDLADLTVRPRTFWPGSVAPSTTSGKIGDAHSPNGPLVFAARSGATETIEHFNGKLDDPTIYDSWLSDQAIDALVADELPANILARWNFAGDQTTLEVPSDCGNWPARLMGMPTRAVTGHKARGDALKPIEHPEIFSAIHFHEDDKHDAGWPTTLALIVPEDWASGIYAFHLSTKHGDEDFVPFFVMPGRTGATAKIAFLVPTFSYLAYGNAHFTHSGESVPEVMAVLRTTLAPYQEYIYQQRLGSTYDEHTDGSGVAYVSRLLPQVNVRPQQISGNNAPHQFNADLHLVDWLYEKHFAHDILTDEALHNEGDSLLQPYRVVITGTHPEYWSGQMLDALEHYLQQGGRVMYMGGNGFYWVTSVHPKAPHVLEVRKYAGTRTWTASPEERHHSTTGEQGGIWRDRGRAPNKLLGVGFAGQGYGSNGIYRRAAASYHGPLAKLFDGIEGDILGDIPSLVWGRGLAGFEVDRIDYTLGSPPNTVCLASSFDHGDLYQLVYEEALAFMVPRELTDANPQLRSDISYLPYPNHGAVFSTGSISFCGALSYNSYKNAASQLIENVLRHFLE